MRSNKLTGMWLKLRGPQIDDISVLVDTDFDLGFGDDDSLAHVLALRERGDISREQEIHEAKRRDILAA